MTTPTRSTPARPRLRCAVVLAVAEDACEVLAGDAPIFVGYVEAFPSPRTERVSPGHLVALARTSDDREVVVWRWYDAVVVRDEDARVRLWEPAHGEVLATPRRLEGPRPVGTRAYLSAGLPGADWWLAGPVVSRAEQADVELDEVARFCTDHGARHASRVKGPALRPCPA